MNLISKAAALALLFLIGCKPKTDAAPEDAGAIAMPAPKPSATVAASAPTAAPSASAAPAGGAYFWNEVAVVEGTLVQKQIEYSPGPVPVVVFDHPITIKPKAGDSTPALAGAKEAWLSYNKIDKAAVAKLVGKKVTYRGTLEPMQTAHHYSNPWLDGTVTAR
jgi:hypothetical protein